MLRHYSQKKRGRKKAVATLIFTACLGILLLRLLRGKMDEFMGNSLILPNQGATVQQQQQQQLPGLVVADETLNRIVYVGMFGLGHRLSKMAAAYHLAQQLQDATQSRLVMEVQWGTCDSAGDDNGDVGGPIFDYLFGSNLLPVVSSSASSNALSSIPSTATDNSSSNIVIKQLWIKNDCHGYYAGQNFKNARQGIPESHTHDNTQSQQQQSPLFQKLDTDRQFFQLLQDRFQSIHAKTNNSTHAGGGGVEDFMQHHSFSKHTVVGLHIRAGNGEQGHFVQANRSIGNHDVFLSNLAALLQQFFDRLHQQQQSNDTTIVNNKPPLIFLATDTPTVIPFLRQQAQAWKRPVQVVTFPQPQLPPSGGVTYSQVKTGQACLEAWKAMMADTILLGHSNVLIAAMRSSFTQIMPLSMVFHCQDDTTNSGESVSGAGTDKAIRPRFCEVGESGRVMTCVENRESWLFRDASREWTLHLDGATTSRTDATAEVETIRSNGIVHKVMAHFPDVDQDDAALKADWDQARSYLVRSSIGQPLATTTKVWGNGNIINQKYRKRGQGFTIEWTILPGND